MKIATWNVERLKHRRQLEEINQAVQKISADILILTETDSQIQQDYPFSFSTPPLSEIQPDYYMPTENRVTVLSNYPCVKQHDTYDKYTALCLELATPKGNLLVYGTIMGIWGNRNKTFRPDVEKQVADIERLASIGTPLCVIGDFNCSFADNYYFTNWARNTLQETFLRSKIDLLTSNVPECIDHIALSSDFISDSQWQVEEWNMDKKLSDHKGIIAEI